MIMSGNGMGWDGLVGGLEGEEFINHGLGICVCISAYAFGIVCYIVRIVLEIPTC
jgi:hypothetical protein